MTKIFKILTFFLLFSKVSIAYSQNGYLDNGAVFNPNGDKIAFHSNRSGHTELWLMDTDGSDLKRITHSESNDRWPQFSADGKKLTFMSRQVGNWEIYAINIDGTNRTRITENNVTDLGSSFSPDGKKIAFTSLRDDDSGIADLYIINTKNKNLHKVAEKAYWPTWSPDGKTIAYTSIIDENMADICLYNVESKTATAITRNSGANFGGKFSNDSQKIIFYSNRDGKFQIFTMDKDGDNLVNLNVNLSGDGNPNISPDGNFILFSNNPNDDADIFLLELKTGKITNITP